MPGGRGGLPKVNHAMGLRRLLLTLPVALAVAAGAHQIRFWDEHAFGEGFHDWLCTVLHVGLPAVGLALLARSAAAARVYADGSIVAERLAELLPGGGRLGAMTAALAVWASVLYIGVELLEDDGDRTFVLALAIIAVLAFLTALAFCRFLSILALATVAFVQRLCSAQDPELPRKLSFGRPQPIAQRAWARVRLGRAPPLR
jgi:hypothetical protein